MEAEFDECVNSDLYNPNWCDQLLEQSNVYELPVYAYWLILVALFATFRLSALLVLKNKATTFY